MAKAMRAMAMRAMAMRSMATRSMATRARHSILHRVPGYPHEAGRGRPGTAAGLVVAVLYFRRLHVDDLVSRPLEPRAQQQEGGRHERQRPRP